MRERWLFFGVLTVSFTYLLFSPLFNRRIGIFSAFLPFGYHFHINRKLMGFFLDVYNYFVKYSPEKNYGGINTLVVTEMAYFLRSAPKGTSLFLWATVFLDL